MTKIQEAINALRFVTETPACNTSKEGEDYKQELLSIINGLNELQAEVDSVEPVAWMFDWMNQGELTENSCVDNEKWLNHKIKEGKVFNVRTLYTSPPARKPLSDDEIRQSIKIVGVNYHYQYIDGYLQGFKAAQKHHNIGVDNE